MHSLLPTPLFRLLVARRTLVSNEWTGNRNKDSFCRLYVPLAGKGMITLEEEELRIEPGFAYLVPSDTSYRLHRSPGLDHYWIHFIAATDTGANLFTLLRMERLQIDLAEHPGYFTDLDQLLTVSPVDSVAEAVRRTGLLNGLLHRFFTDDNLHWLVPMRAYARFSRVFSYIEQHFTDQIPVAFLAGLVGLHPTYFSNLFSRRFGLSPVRYINKVRINKAQVLLLTTDRRIKEVGGLVGFANEYYFSEAFKQYTGVNPREYRRINRFPAGNGPVG